MSFAILLACLCKHAATLCDWRIHVCIASPACMTAVYPSFSPPPILCLFVSVLHESIWHALRLHAGNLNSIPADEYFQGSSGSSGSHEVWTMRQAAMQEINNCANTMMPTPYEKEASHVAVM